jgi:Tol biopolymer transport system component
MPTDQEGVWSPDGTALAYPGIEDGSSPAKQPLHHLWVQTIDSGNRVELRTPARPSYSVLAWESTGQVLVEVRQTYGKPAAPYRPGLIGLLRCSASSGACERVADGPARHAVLADVY